jgi:hypothetical protein
MTVLTSPPRRKHKENLDKDIIEYANVTIHPDIKAMNSGKAPNQFSGQ